MIKTSSIAFFPKVLVILYANNNEGLYLEFSKAFIVWRVTPTNSANSC